MTDKTLSYKGYCGSIKISLDDDCLYGEILFINDLVTYEATHPAELEQQFKNAVDYYLEKCRQDGTSPDKPFNGSFNVRFSPELHRAAGMEAARNGQSLNDFVKECVEHRLSNKTVHVTENHIHYHGNTSVVTTNDEYQEDADNLWQQQEKVQSKRQLPH
jgi:predicted HicB family RNase H-like nuclease